MDLGIEGKVALVTGAHRGTGAGTARALAAEGAIVAVHGFSAGDADPTVASIEAAGGRAVAVHGDLLSDDGVGELFSVLDDVVGAPQIVVNNYGTTVASTWDTPASDWHEAWERNVVSGVRVTQAALAPMRAARWGRVVFLATVGTARPGVANPDYYGAKTGLVAVARSLAQHERDTGITVNVVSPGVVATDEVRATATRRAARSGVEGTWAEVERWVASSMMPNLVGRVAEPDEIGRVVAFVCSEHAWYLDGIELRADGGAVDARDAAAPRFS